MFIDSTSGAPAASQLLGFDKTQKADSGNPEIRYFNYYYVLTTLTVIIYLCFKGLNNIKNRYHIIFNK